MGRKEVVGIVWRVLRYIGRIQGGRGDREALTMFGLIGTSLL